MKKFESKTIVLTSGKGGTGKTVSAAAIAAETAKRGKKTVIIDFDIGLRQVDLVMGCEVIFDFIDVIQQEASLNQALIKDHRQENLYILPASQTDNKDALTRDGVASVLEELESTFDFIICDSPPGTEYGSYIAAYFADEAIVVVNPDPCSVRDADRTIGMICQKSRRAELGLKNKVHLLVNRYNYDLAKKNEILSTNKIQEILEIPLLGIIPESSAVLTAINRGIPVTLSKNNDAKAAYAKIVDKLIYNEKSSTAKGFFAKILERFKLFRSPHHGFS